MLRTKPVMYKRVRVDASEARRGPGTMAYVACVAILPAFLLGLAFVKLKSDQTKLRHQLTEMRRDFGLRSKELANVELEVEMYRNGNRIFGQVQRMGLGLQMPRRGQVTRVRTGSAPVTGSRSVAETVLAER